MTSKIYFKIHFKYFKSILRSKSKMHLKTCMLGTPEWMIGTVKIYPKFISNILNSFSDQNEQGIWNCVCWGHWSGWWGLPVQAGWVGGWGRLWTLSPRQLSLHVLAAIKTCRLYFLFKSCSLASCVPTLVPNANLQIIHAPVIQFLFGVCFCHQSICHLQIFIFSFHQYYNSK